MPHNMLANAACTDYCDLGDVLIGPMPAMTEAFDYAGLHAFSTLNGTLAEAAYSDASTDC